jgi:hypothetical protein
MDAKLPVDKELSAENAPQLRERACSPAKDPPSAPILARFASSMGQLMQVRQKITSGAVAFCQQ